MSPTKDANGYRNHLLAIIVTILIAVSVSVLFDYYYEFNDDVLMKDILSGAYTGHPESHNIQMLWPISAFIAFLYRILPIIPWYGVFLCACQFGCVAILIYRVLCLLPTLRGKAVAASIVYLFVFALALPHLVMVQYTITVAIIAAVAAFFFYTIPMELDNRRFMGNALCALLLVWLGFMIRSEMMLLMLPFIGITGLIRWNRETHALSKQNIIRYVGTFGILLLGMGAFWSIDKLAYSSDAWKAFLAEFDSRTQLYDYQYVPTYNENRAFYESIGLSKADVELLANYDYGLDSKIDAQVIGQVADYADKLRMVTLGERIIESLKEYVYECTHFTYGIFSVLTAFLYFMLVWAILARKECTWLYKIKIIFYRVIAIFAVRTIPWLYIIIGRRKPIRITHSLFIVEDVILFGMLIVELSSKVRDGRFLQMLIAVICVGGGILIIPNTVTSLNAQIESQERINRLDRAIDAYCMERPDNFYFIDVYSTIREGETFNEKMFKKNSNTIENHDLIGGWAVNSPIYWEKLGKFGINDISQDILTRDDIYIICDGVYSMSWLTDYYMSQGDQVYAMQVDQIAGTFGVYQIVPSE